MLLVNVSYRVFVCPKNPGTYFAFTLFIITEVLLFAPLLSKRFRQRLIRVGLISYGSFVANFKSRNDNRRNIY